MTPISAQTRLGFVIGDPVAHSRSPAMHNAAFAAVGIDAVFLAVRVAPDDLAAAADGMRALRPLGVSVTVPHKQEMFALVDEVVAPADRIGAVNCIVVGAGGCLIGHNTDAAAFVDGVGDVAGKRVVVLGSGGAARAVCAGLEDAGVASIEVATRTPSHAHWVDAHEWTAEALAELCADCDLLVDCTSMGLSAEAERLVPASVPVDRLPDRALVATLVYHRETELLAAARARGLRTVDGAAMLVHQGARAFELWTGVAAPVDVMSRSIGTR